MGKTLLHALLSPAKIFDAALAATASSVVFGNFQQTFRTIVPSIQNDILDSFTQILGQVVVDRQLAGVDDSHVHASLDRVIKKY